MAWGDGTGPNGAGPMTGRGAGYCAGYSVPGYANPAVGGGYRGFGRGRGWGRGFGRGYGRGFGRGWGASNYGYGAAPVAPYVPAVSAGQEADILKNEAKALENEIKAINDRIKVLEKDASKSKK